MEAGLIARGHLLAGEIADAALLLVLLNVAPAARPGGRSRRTGAASAALRALALVPLIRLVGLGLPLRDGSDALGTLTVALLVGFAGIRLAPSVGVSLRSMAAARRLPDVQMGTATAGLALGLVAYLAGTPRLWSPDAGGDTVLVVVLAAVAAAVVEELVFRGLVQVTFSRVMGRVGPVVASALFAATYLEEGQAAQVLVFALAGLIFAHAVARSGALTGAVGGHVLLILGAGGLWPVLLGQEDPPPLRGPAGTVALGVAVLGMTAILLRATVARGLRPGVPRGRTARRMGGLRLAAAARLTPPSGRVLDPAAAVVANGARDVSVLDSRAIGAWWLAERLWERLELGDAILAAWPGPPSEAQAMEQGIFAMVAERLSIAPLTNLAGRAPISRRASVEGLAVVCDDAVYRAMEPRRAVLPALQERVFCSIASLPNLEVDKILVDTNSTYAAADRKTRVGMGMALTRTGIPVRVWIFPADASHEENLQKVGDEVRGWSLPCVIWVLDRGTTGAGDHRRLESSVGHHIVGERLRGHNGQDSSALATSGRYHVVAGNLRVKEVRVEDATEAGRCVISHDPEHAARDRVVREQVLGQLTAQFAGSDLLSVTKQRELYDALAAEPAYERFLRRAPTGKPRIDGAAVASEAEFDGKFLLRTSDESLSAADLAIAYRRALYEGERGWRDLKSAIDPRPVLQTDLGGHVESRIQLGWLALLLRRVAETATGMTWSDIRTELDGIHVVTLATGEGAVAQRTELTLRQRKIIKALGLSEPPRSFEFMATADRED